MRLKASAHKADWARRLVMHGAVLAVITLSVFIIFFVFYAKPKDSLILEGESFAYQKGDWVEMQDVNLSSYKGIMSRKTGAEAEVRFDVPKGGEYALWIKYFGNYGPNDLALWKRAYTNSLGYIDYFGALEPLYLSVRINDKEEPDILQEGRHRYRWAKAGVYAFTEGPHTLSVRKKDAVTGSVNIDAAMLTADLLYNPGRAEALPRQVSEYLAPALISVFPIVIWFYTRKTRAGGHYEAVLYSTAFSLVLSVLWIDTDGGFWIWLTQNNGFTVSTIYSEGNGSEALHHRYVYPPPVALMLIGLRPIYALFGAADGITVAPLILSKLIIIPFVIGTAVLLYKLEGHIASVLWSLSSLVIFTIAANSMYFGLALIFALFIYSAKKERFHLSALLFGAAMAYLSVTTLLLPPFLLLLRNFRLRQAVAMAALAILPGVLILIPYQFMDPVGLNHRVMGAGIATWMSMHLGLKLGNIGITSLLYGALLSYVWVKRPAFDYLNLSAIFSLTVLIYLNIGAPYFLMWSVAFQPFLIISACRLRKEVFYSIYITALMVWGSFAMNTGGADDRAGETGFFPYYIFYSWPFDVYSFLRHFYKKIDFFSHYDLEALTHSMSAGVSMILFILIAERLHRQEALDEK